MICPILQTINEKDICIDFDGLYELNTWRAVFESTYQIDLSAERYTKNYKPKDKCCGVSI